MSSIFLLLAILGPACYALANLCDHRLSVVFAADHTLQIAISKVLQALLILPFFVYLRPSLPEDGSTLLILALCVVLEFTYVYPYLWAFEHAETEIVVSLFSFGKVLVPLMAWMVLGEVLYLSQYFGFALIVVSGLAMTFNFRQFHFNRALPYMFLASLLLAVNSVATKSVLNEGVSWIAFTSCSMMLEGAVGVILLLLRLPSLLRHCVVFDRSVNRLIILESSSCLIGFGSVIYATSFLPVTMTKAIGGLQPLFVVLFASALDRKRSVARPESPFDRRVLVKCGLFALMILGTVMTLNPS